LLPSSDFPELVVQAHWAQFLLSVLLLGVLITSLEMVAAARRAEEARRPAETGTALRSDGERFAAILQTQQEIATAGLDRQAVLDLIITRTQELTHAGGAVLGLLKGDQIVCQAASGLIAPHVGLRITRGLARQCARTGRHLRSDDVTRDRRVNREVSRHAGARALIAAPLYHEQEIVGVLCAASSERSAFDSADEHTLQLLAGLAGAAMSHRAESEARQRLQAEAQERADFDPLTGLLNHRAFHLRLDQEVERARRERRPLAVVIADVESFNLINQSYGYVAGDDVLRQVTAVLRQCCRPWDVLARFGPDEFAILMPSTGVEEAARRARLLGTCIHTLSCWPPGAEAAIPLALSVGTAVFPTEAAAPVEALELAAARLGRSRYGAADGPDVTEALRTHLGENMPNFSLLSALVTAVDNKDRYTRRHSEDVMAYSLEIAQGVGLGIGEVNTLRVAALLHDVGKIGVPNAILRKPGRLSDMETAAIRQHPLMGASMVGALPGFEDTLDGIRHHHERWDGQGYPHGLAGENIPRLARILAVADAFSAMTMDRPYRKGLIPEKALALLEEGAGTQWDPECVQAFLCARQAAAAPQSVVPVLRLAPPSVVSSPAFAV